MNGAWPGRPAPPPPRKEFDEEYIMMNAALAWTKRMHRNPQRRD
jgi:hypothetical protein